MSERPILFNGEMVRAILAGTKTQTRRPVVLEDFKASDTTGCDFAYRDKRSLWDDVTTARLIEKRCPFGMPGDTLWVRETWAAYTTPTYEYGECDEIECSPRDMRVDGVQWVRREDVVYQADGASSPSKWRPSIHMPRWASRLSLRVTDVRVQRVQDIIEADARAEGVQSFFERFTSIGRDQCITSGERAIDAPSRASFACTWDDIYGDKAPWSASPWVWAVSFERVQS